MKHSVFIISILFASLFFTSPVLAGAGWFDLPRDPEGSFDKILESKIIVVGVVHSPPFVDVTTSSVSGSEVLRVEGFARRVGVEARFVVTGVEDGFQALRDKKVHVLIGGILKDNPYTDVGFTRSYDGTRVFAVINGENRLVVELEKYLGEVKK